MATRGSTASTHRTSPELSRQERFDLRLSRAFPKLAGHANRLLIRLTRGRLGSRKRGIPIGLLTSTGRRSGQPRTTPLMYLEAEDRYLVVAANGGYDRPPAWLRNLEASPEAQFELDGRRLRVQARVLDPAERARLWPRLIAPNPLWAGFQSYTERETTVVALDPEPGTADATRSEAGDSTDPARGT